MRLVETYGDRPTDMFRRSREMQARAIEEIPEGASSNYRGQTAYAPYPMVFIEHAEGAMITDVDGNEYIDFHAGISSLITGHRVNAQLEAVREQLERGSYFAAAYENEHRTAALLNDLVPSSDFANFFCTGTEAVMNALQLARAYTGRDKILKFEGMYHGTTDNMMVNVHPDPTDLGTRRNATKIPAAPGIPRNATETVETLPWNDADLLERYLTEHGSETAAIITEALMSNSGLLWPDDPYLHEVQRLANEYDVLFILDEVITGFRMHLHGAQGYFGLDPDLSIFGKALGNGYPCSAVCGTAEVMEFVGGGSDTANFAGTFSGNPLATAGVKGNLEVLQELGEAGYDGLYAKGERLIRGLREIFADAGEDVFIPPFAGFTYIHFTDGADSTEWGDWRDIAPHVVPERYNQFASEMMARGVFLPPKNDRINLMHAHTDEHIDETLDVAAAAVERLP